MAHKAVIYVALFLSIAQVVMSSSSSSSESDTTLVKGRKNFVNGVQYRGSNKNYEKPNQGDGEELMEEKEDNTEWYLKVLRDAMVEDPDIYGALKDVEEITFPIDGHKNEEIAILHGLELNEIQDAYKAFEPIAAKESALYSPVDPPVYNMLTTITEVSKDVLGIDQNIKKKAEEAMRKAEEDRKKAEEAKKTTDVRKAKAANPKPTPKSKSSPKRKSSPPKKTRSFPA